MSPNSPAPEWGSFLFVLRLARRIALKIWQAAGAAAALKWSSDALRVELVLYAGNNLDKARGIFRTDH
jgi:hypothetical protein